MNLWYKPNFLAVLFICVISFFAMSDLQIPGLYTSHDGETHTARIAQYYEALKDGQFPPRYAGSFYNGFGSPIFVYIYPLPYILGSILHSIKFSFVDSFKIAMGLGFAFSGIFAYFWLKELLGNKPAAFVGALYYMYSPYRLQLIYVRGSISELLAYTFLPLALYSTTRLDKSYSTKQLVYTTLSLTGVLLSQNLVAFLTLPIVLGFALFLSASKKTFSTFQNVFLATIWAFAISAFTYVPALFERNYIKFNEVFKLVYGSHFVTLKQLVRSPWGYGFDLPGTVNDEMSFTLGLAHWLIIILPFLAFLVFILKKSLLNQKNIKYFSAQNTVVVFSYLLIAACLFLVNDNVITKFIWKNISFLQIIDIPWRILGIVPVAVAIIGAVFVAKYKHGLLLVGLVFAVIIANRNHIHINKALNYTDESFINYQGTATQLSEFTPSERRSVSSPAFTSRDLPINTAGGWAKYANVSQTSKKIKFNVTVISDTAQIRVNKFNFPGVQVKAYNNNMRTKPKFTSSASGSIRLDTTQDTNGFIYFSLDKGTYDIEISFGETLLRKFANLISLLAMLLAGYFLIQNAKKT